MSPRRLSRTPGARRHQEEMTSWVGLANFATLAFVTSAVPVSTFFATAKKPEAIAGCPRAGLYLLRLGHGASILSDRECDVDPCRPVGKCVLVQ